MMPVARSELVPQNNLELISEFENTCLGLGLG
jgi:hypothetical protein